MLGQWKVIILQWEVRSQTGVALVTHCYKNRPTFHNQFSQLWVLKIIFFSYLYDSKKRYLKNDKDSLGGQIK